MHGFETIRGSHQGYEFQHGPAGSVPPPVTFMDSINGGRYEGGDAKKILAERDRYQQDIIQMKSARPKS